MNMSPLAYIYRGGEIDMTYSFERTTFQVLQVDKMECGYLYYFLNCM